MKWAFALLSVLVLTSCYKDKGNYAYTEINEANIDTFTQQYNAYYLVDTLKITPKINFTMDPGSADRYSYQWSLISGRFNGGSEFKIRRKGILIFR